ncbi:MAG: hypothetical protein ACOX0F_13905 [Syntrophomonadaceae bacterium]|jgi:phage baseplate assembly protein W
MEYDVLAQTLEIDFAPKNELAEILQNVRTIISTPKYSVPLNRRIGLSMLWLDDPLPVAQAKLTAEIISELPQWEPRVRVTQVTYIQDGINGVLMPKVRVRIANEQLT